MIVWINGGFGAGKTSVSEYLKEAHGYQMFDPETVGFYLRDTLPMTMVTPDFQDMPLWRSVNNDILKSLSALDEHVMVPMTVTDKQYFDELTKNVDFLHIVLINAPETLSERLLRRGDKDPWAFDQINRCYKALPLMEGHHIVCDDLTVEEVGRKIIEVMCKKTMMTIKAQ